MAVIRMLKCAAVVAATTLIIGCVNMPAPPYQPGVDNTERLLSGRGEVAVGAFQAAEGVENKRLGMRGSGLQGGSDGTFSTYLKEALKKELEEANRFQEDATTSISGKLVKNSLSTASASRGQSSLAAEFAVMHSGDQVYRKTLEINHQWPSSFMGAIAIPAAIEGYSATVQKLLGELFADPDFQNAIQRGIAVN